MKLWLVRAIDAVSESDLDADTKAIMKELVAVSDWHTATGRHSQETIARRTSLSVRHVREKLKWLAARNSGIRITRRRRPSEDGRGRGSDEWTVWIPDAIAPGQNADPERPGQPARCAHGTSDAEADQPARRAG